MSYREKIEKYKRNQLSEEERKEIEAEIEKTEAINDYLTDQLEEELMQEGMTFQKKGSEDEKEVKKLKEEEKNEENDKNPDGKKEKNKKNVSIQDEKQFEEYVKKSIHRIFRKMALGTGAVLLVILLFVQFGLSPLVSLFYYNPAKQIKTEMESDDGSEKWERSESQFELDFRIYSELTIPCRNTDNVQTFSQGYGNYVFQIIPSIGYAAQTRTGTAGQINKGKLETYTPGYFNAAQDNYFIAYGLDRNKSFREQMENSVTDYGDHAVSTSQWCYASLEEARQFIDDLDEDGFYYAYVSFDQPLSFEEVKKLMDRLQENTSMIGQPWIAVYTSEGSYGRTLGYNYENTTWEIPSEYNQKYPELSLFDKNSYSDEVYKEAEKKLTDEKAMTQHMVSMLRYMADQKRFTNMMEDESKADINWRVAADYVEENGLSSYGFACVTTKADMQKMLKEDHILGIAADSWK